MEGMGPMLPEGAVDPAASPLARICLGGNTPSRRVEADLRSRRLAVRNTFIHIEDDEESDTAELQAFSLLSRSAKSAPTSPTCALIHPPENAHLNVTRAEDDSRADVACASPRLWPPVSPVRSNAPSTPRPTASPNPTASPSPTVSPTPSASPSPAASQSRRLAVRNTFIHVEDEDDEEHGEFSLFRRVAQSAPSSPTKAMAVQAGDEADDVASDVKVRLETWSGTPSSSSSVSLLTELVSKERRAGKDDFKAEAGKSTPRSGGTRSPFASSSPCRHSEVDMVAESTTCSTSGRSDMVDLSRLSLSSYSSASPRSPSRRNTVRSTISYVEEEEPFEDELGSSLFQSAPNDFPSLGSASHGAGWCKPCAFVLKQEGCRLNFQCAFCHLCGPGAKRRRQRQKKEMIQARTVARRLQREAALASKGSDARGKNAAPAAKGSG